MRISDWSSDVCSSDLDFNDFEVGKRAGFKPGDMLNMFDAEANVVQTADGLIPEEYLGLHRFRRDSVDGARELVVRSEERRLGKECGSTVRFRGATSH